MIPERPKPKIQGDVLRRESLLTQRKLNGDEIKILQDRYQDLMQQIKAVGEQLTQKWEVDAGLSRQLGAMNQVEAENAFRQKRI